MLTRAIKPKVCRHCKAAYQPMSSTAKACSVPCALALAGETRAKAEKVAALADRKDTRAKLEAIKSRSTLAREAQHAFNAWIRARDSGRPCISCGRRHQGQNHAGHYLSRGSRPELAYEPLNCHLQCAPCNTHLSGNQVLYRKALVQRIGIEQVEWLEGPHAPKHYTHDQLRAIKAQYQLQTRQIKKENAS